ncbi:DCC1-like thiol-disulfide oxidoreductase family protein [Myxococcus stipitatus]|uniref:thiol-disulfide oxidoreductase DCC family protein n=1 Tax=Myxococcus stipitatus TaxID=83455 RepID=UPI001F16A653|nr:DCC1-like thiol-disulfide oxidoreductase family protein [Myxococcus stipitatus]MCE9672169.1 DCC1-like thiol-disulfide oxidoreductase family protein [Myxococcus stipitatus]
MCPEGRHGLCSGPVHSSQRTRPQLSSAPLHQPAALNWAPIRPILSEQAAALLAPVGRIPEMDPQSFILVEDGRIYERSTAALRVVRRLSGAWKLLYAFMLVPRPLRDVVYGLIARNRYRLFGKAESCRMPTPELRARFL